MRIYDLKILPNSLEAAVLFPLKNTVKQILSLDITHVFLKRSYICHEDFANLGQFCAKINTYYLSSYTKCPCKTTRKISNEFYQGQLTIITFFGDFDNIASKREKIFAGKELLNMYITGRRLHPSIHTLGYR